MPRHTYLTGKEHCRLSAPPQATPQSQTPTREGRAGQLAPTPGTLGASHPPGKQAPIALRGRAPALEAQPGSPIAPRGAPTRLREGNQAPEQMAGPPIHEPGGGGHLAPSRRAARATTTRAHAPAPRRGETWARSIKIPRPLAALGGRAHPQGRPGMRWGDPGCGA